jgi:hypothetical protein
VLILVEIRPVILVEILEVIQVLILLTGIQTRPGHMIQIICPAAEPRRACHA